jgi:hypothetical protein
MYEALQRLSDHVACAEDSKYPSLFELVKLLYLSVSNLIPCKLMSFLGVVSDTFHVRYSSLNSVVQLRNVTWRYRSSIIIKTLKQISSFVWMRSLWNRAIAFERLPLVHICRMMERRAHRKEFRRKGCLDLGILKLRVNIVNWSAYAVLFP